MTEDHGLPLTEDAQSSILRLIRRLDIEPTLEEAPLVLADWQAYLHFLFMVLCTGLVSFAGSHVCRFDINIWKQPMQEISVGFGYTFSLRQLACLDKFIGGPAWILGKSEPQLEQRAIKISLEVGDFQELWGPIWLLGGYPEKGPIIRTERGYIIPLPRHEQNGTELEEIENLQACWPFTDSFMNHRISSSKETHNWFRAVKDTRDVSTFAVVSQRCLEFREQGISQLCTNLGGNELSRPLQTVLCTRVLLDSAFAADVGAGDHRLGSPPQDGLMATLQNTNFLLGEAHPTMRRTLRKDLIFTIIAVSSNPWQRRLRTVLAERKIPRLQEQIDLDITTGTLGLLFVY